MRYILSQAKIREVRKEVLIPAKVHHDYLRHQREESRLLLKALRPDSEILTLNFPKMIEDKEELFKSLAPVLAENDVSESKFYRKWSLIVRPQYPQFIGEKENGP